MKSVYYAIFESHLCYASLFWDQNPDVVKMPQLLQKKPLRIMFFRAKTPMQALYLKTPKFLSPLRRLFLKIPFLLANLQSSYRHLSWIAGSNILLSFTLTIIGGQILVILTYRLTELKQYGGYSMIVNAIHVWNHLQSCHQNFILYQLSKLKLEEILMTYFLNRNNQQTLHI